MRQIKEFIERTGIYIFFVSLIIFIQINWLKQHNRYAELELRLFAGFLIGLLLSIAVIKLIKVIITKTCKDQETFFKNLSMVLAPGMLFIFASNNKIFLVIGIVLCILTALYIWVKPFRDIVSCVIFLDKFKNILIIENNKAMINMEGTYVKANPRAIQSFLIDLVINFYECSEMKIGEVRVDFSKLKDKDENELKPLIESIARYFDLEIIY